MAEYLVQSENLSAVANAIRSKGETSAQLTFPNGFIDAIGAIKGLPDGVLKLAYGTYTPTSSGNYSISMKHNFGVYPSFALFFAELNGISMADFGQYSVSAISIYEPLKWSGVGDVAGHSLQGYSNGAIVVSDYDYSTKPSSTSTVTIYGEKQLKVGVTYRWIVGYIDGM